MFQSKLAYYRIPTRTRSYFIHWKLKIILLLPMNNCNDNRIRRAFLPMMQKLKVHRVVESYRLVNI